MDECFKCGIPDDRMRLFDAIGDEGIVKICEMCSNREDIPVIRKPTTFQLKESERKQTIYQRLSHAAGIQEKPVEKQEKSLRDIVDKNMEEKMEEMVAVPRPDLIDNFHWMLMRARRSRKITQEQLAKEIGESEAAIKMAEKGILPEDDYNLLYKLENFFRISLIQKDTRELMEEKIPPRVAFDPATTKTLTIADLQEMKKNKEDSSEVEIDYEEIDKAPLGVPQNIEYGGKVDLQDEPELSSDDEEKVETNSGDLSDDDINDMIFRR
jgi:ribosome-binding protein aMBF1 (putative translation factor)